MVSTRLDVHRSHVRCSIRAASAHDHARVAGGVRREDGAHEAGRGRRHLERVGLREEHVEVGGPAADQRRPPITPFL